MVDYEACEYSFMTFYMWQHVFNTSYIIKDGYLNIFGREEGDRYFDCKVQFTMIDENSGKEKKTIVKILVKADNIKEATSNLDEGMKGTMSDYSSVLIKETDIMDIYKYE